MNHRHGSTNTDTCRRPDKPFIRSVGTTKGISDFVGRKVNVTLVNLRESE